MTKAATWGYQSHGVFVLSECLRAQGITGDQLMVNRITSQSNC